AGVESWGHALEVGYKFQRENLPVLLADFNGSQSADDQMPHLAALVCCSAFDIALHDAYGKLHGLPTYDTYTSQFLSRDLANVFSADGRDAELFRGKYPADFLAQSVPTSLPVWHLVGGLDPLDRGDFTGNEPNDGYPIALTDWIGRDGLKCLKVKLRGN